MLGPSTRFTLNSRLGRLETFLSSRDGALSCVCFNRDVPRRFAQISRPKLEPINIVKDGEIEVLGRCYPADDWTNITPNIASKLGRNLHTQRYNPLNFIRKKIEKFFLQQQDDVVLHRDDSIHSVFDNLSPVVTTKQNFDDLLIPDDHVSRNKGESYYLNRDTLLRAHTSAHQRDLIKSGLNSFLLIGDVYRRDTIDRSHYPVFHQMEGVRLFSERQLFKDQRGSHVEGFQLFEANGLKTTTKQSAHSPEAARMVEFHLKSTLTSLAHHLFGKNIQIRWVDAYFPFTHPSWEMEIYYSGEWMEVLGCGVVEQPIVCSAGVDNRVGWAFGLGLERLAMILYQIPDIRLFWSTDSGFTHQFEGKSDEDVIAYVPISKYPQNMFDMSFWLPEGGEATFDPNDYYDLVREVAGDLAEQVKLFDVFVHPKTRRTSHCYHVIYRHMSRALTNSELNAIHGEIAQRAEETLNVDVRNKL